MVSQTINIIELVLKVFAVCYIIFKVGKYIGETIMFQKQLTKSHEELKLIIQEHLKSDTNSFAIIKEDLTSIKISIAKRH